MRGLVGLVGLVLAASAMPASAETRDWPVTGFDKVQLDAAADVAITTGQRFSMRADGDPDLIARLAPVVRADTLQIAWRGPAPHVRNGRLRIAITLPRLAGAGLHGAGHVTADRADAQTVVVAIDGAGSIAIASVKASRAVLSLKGTGSITVAGSADWIDARKSGVGSIDAKALTARGGVLDASGIGSIDARVDGPVTATLSGIGSIDISGHPTCTTHRSGIGQISCGG